MRSDHHHRFASTLRLFGLALLAACSTAMGADSVEDVVVEDIEAAVATDVPTYTPPAAEVASPPEVVAPEVVAPEVVAREVMRLQEEMGGSIVSGLEAAPGWNTPPMPRQKPHAWRTALDSPVLALRQTAWQLEQSAHLLESLDLYSQADALRETADELRQDARKMKAKMTSVDAE